MIAIFLALALSSQPAFQLAAAQTRPEVLAQELLTTIQRLSGQIAQAQAARPNQPPLTPELQAARDRAVRSYLIEQLRYAMRDIDENLARVEELPAEDLTRLRDHIKAIDQAASLLRQVK